MQEVKPIKLKVKDKSALYVFKVENALCCDLCDMRDVSCIEFENEDETQVCKSCIEQLYKISQKIL